MPHAEEHTLDEHVPVFLVTARAMVSERARGIAAGADAYITKPFVNKELIEQVRAIWDKAAGVES